MCAHALVSCSFQVVALGERAAPSDVNTGHLPPCASSQIFIVTPAEMISKAFITRTESLVEQEALSSHRAFEGSVRAALIHCSFQSRCLLLHSHQLLQAK